MTQKSVANRQFFTKLFAVVCSGRICLGFSPRARAPPLPPPGVFEKYTFCRLTVFGHAWTRSGLKQYLRAAHFLEKRSVEFRPCAYKRAFPVSGPYRKIDRSDRFSINAPLAPRTSAGGVFRSEARSLIIRWGGGGRRRETCACTGNVTSGRTRAIK